MGVEYTHGFFVEDLAWVPELEHARAILEVLEKWRLTEEDGGCGLYDTTGNKRTQLERRWLPALGKRPRRRGAAPTLANLDRLPGNLLAQIPGTSSEDALTEALGPGDHRRKGGQNAFTSWDLLLGLDFEVCNTFYVKTEVLEPPREGRSAVKPYENYNEFVLECWPIGTGPAYPGSAKTKPPRAKASSVDPDNHEHGPIPEGWSGVFRSGLQIDFGKCIPHFADERKPVPNSTFVKELEAAFGTRLLQMGWFH